MDKKKYKNLINNIVVIITVIAVIVTTFNVINNRGDVPDNPMKDKLADASKVYENSNLNLDDIDNSQNQEDTNNKSNKSDINSDYNTANKSDKSDNDSSNNTDNRSNDVENNRNDNNNNNNKGNQNTKNIGNKNTNLNNTSKKSRGSNPSNTGPGKDGGKYVSHVKNKKVKKEYFSTTIKDGETISTYEYSFKIKHLIDSLTVEQQLVYVNEMVVTNFDGRVVLKEGANDIRISITYRTEDGQEINAQKKYTVNVDTENLFISTDLKNQTVSSPIFKFFALAKMGNNNGEMFLSLNGKNITGENGKYSVVLKEGENEIIAKGKYGKYEITKTFKIVLEYQEGFGIETDLENQTVNADKISFFALVRNGSSKAKLSVIVNGDIIEGSQNAYSTKLEIGNNTIRLKAVDTGGVSINKTYTVKYVPLATKDTEPILEYINIKDGMDINGETFTLYIGAKDYKDNRIYYDGIEVKLNGKKIQYRWSAKYVGYLLNLQNGINNLEIKLTDNQGRYKVFTYKVKCTYIDQGTVIGTATVSIDAKVIHLGVLLKPKKVDIYYGDSAADVFERAMDGSGFTFTNTGTTGTGFYLESIGRPGILKGWKIDDKLKKEIQEDGLQFNIDPATGNYVYDMDSLSEFDFCQGSGWTYCVNGEFKEYGMSEYKPKDGDNILIRYTLAYGKDIGGYNQSGTSYGIKDKYDITY
ncbi:MAG: DUF4430 domain-containing protein [Eubacterium sp.]|nr:DUF4430 domain-containing protein [Eubacterium sp.]